MTRYPGSTWDPLGPQTAKRMQAHDIVCLHTMVGRLAGTSTMFHKDGYGGTESHFGMGHDGATLQWQDLAFKADANYHGNHRVISMETADKGAGFPNWIGSNVPAWTPQQVDKLVDWLLWVTSREAHADCPTSWMCHHNGIPRALVPDSKPTRRGIAYHRQGVDSYPRLYAPGWRQSGGELWSASRGKVCPGDRRIHQLVTVIVPRVQAATAQPAQPAPQILQEPDMIMVITAPGKPPRAIVDGKLIGFKPDPAGGSQYADFRAAVEKAEPPISVVDWACDVAQYDATSALYSAPEIVVSPPFAGSGG